MKSIIELEDSIHNASRRIRASKAPPVLTPLTKSVGLSNLFNANVYFKEENRQITGSFKYRGALNKILTLSTKEQNMGIVTASSGNHGTACSVAADKLGLQCEVFLPSTASKLKVQRIKDYGAKVTVVKGDCLVAEQTAKQYANDNNKTYLSPYNDLNVIAGQGTIGDEIAKQLPDVDQVFVAVGGGGLISGIGSTLIQYNNNIDIVGCWPMASPVMYQCMQANRIIHVTESDTLSDGTAGNIEPDAITLNYCKKVIGSTELVSEEKIKAAFIYMLEHEQLFVEGAAAMTVACAIQHYENRRQNSVVNNNKENIVIVLCGKNMSFETLQSIVST